MASKHFYRLNFIAEKQPEGSYTITCCQLPELITEGDTIEEIHKNVIEALEVTLGLYEATGRKLPDNLITEISDDTEESDKNIEMIARIPAYL